MQVSGTRGAVTLNGYRVRNALVGRTRCSLSNANTTGRQHRIFHVPWTRVGTRVGCAEVGAFGMARAGHSYEEILKTYYQGVEIRKAY